MDDVGLDDPLVGVADAEAVDRAGHVPVDEHVGRSQQVPEDVPTLGPAQVERHAALVLVHLQVGRAVVRGDLAEHVAQVVAAAPATRP